MFPILPGPIPTGLPTLPEVHHGSGTSLVSSCRSHPQFDDDLGECFSGKPSREPVGSPASVSTPAKVGHLHELLSDTQQFVRTAIPTNCSWEESLGRPGSTDNKPFHGEQNILRRGVNCCF